MQLLDRITVHHKSDERYIELYQGDLIDMPPEEAVDVLVVSARPNSYNPVPESLIGALHRKKISVAQLATHKAVDLREMASCWMSQEIDLANAEPGIQFKRILCFEPHSRGEPPEVVGDIFQSLMPFVNADPPITTVAMPLVASGRQGVPLADMLEPLIDAAVHWLALGLPVTHLKIVEISELKAAELKGAFAILKKQYQDAQLQASSDFTYDLFISYSHQNSDEVLKLVEILQSLKPDLRIFFDRHNLDTGMAWQQELYEALDDCRKVLVVYSPPYLTSKVCKEEFNIAQFRHRDSEDGILLPIYLYSSELPTYMKLLQFVDCREGDWTKLEVACQNIIKNL